MPSASRMKERARRKITPAELRAHALKRAQERYDPTATRQLLTEIEFRIQNNRAIKVANQYWARSVWHVVVKDRVYYVVHDDFHKCVCTFLDPEMDVVRNWKLRMDLL